MSTTGGALIATKDDKSECAWNISSQGVCAKEVIPRYKEYLKVHDPLADTSMSGGELLDRMKIVLNVDSESGVLTHPDFSSFAGSGIVKRALNNNLKAP